MTAPTARIVGRLLLCAALFGLLAGAHATTVSCASSATNINLGAVSALGAGGGAVSSGTVTWTCYNTGGFQTAYVTFCLNIGSGTGGTAGNLRLLTGGTPALEFQLYQDAANTLVWGSLLSGPNGTPYQTQFVVPANGTYSGSATVYAAIPAGQGGLAPGTYSSSFTTTNSAVSGTYSVGSNSYPASCGNYNSGIYFPFTVTATVTKQCVVAAASNINLGTVASTQSNIAGTNNITVSCSSGTPYFVGMMPANASADGAGLLTGKANPANTVPYQLYANAARTQVWGNTATSATAGNGVAGTGTGGAQSLPVWAVVPSANQVPDSYADTVTINVNF